MSAPSSTSRRTSRLAATEPEQKSGRPSAPKQSQPPAQSAADESEEEEDYSEDYCAYCGAEGILAICDVPQCGKVYHAECLGYNPSGLTNFFCPRHRCALCNRPDVEIDSAGGIELIKCKSCPTSYCPHHKPEEADFKKAMSVSTVDPLPDTAVMGLFVPHPDTSIEQGRMGAVAATDETGPATEIDDSLTRPSKRPRVQFAVESGVEGAVPGPAGASNGGEAQVSQGERGEDTAAGSTSKNAFQDVLRRKPSDDDSDQDTVPDSAVQSGDEGEGRASEEMSTAKGNTAAQGRRKGFVAGKPPLPPAGRRPGTRLASAAQPSAGSAEGTATSATSGGGTEVGQSANGLVSGASTPGEQSDADSTGPRRSKRKRLSEGQLEKAVAGMSRTEGEGGAGTGGQEGVAVLTGTASGHPTEPEDALDTERIAPAATAASRLSVSIAPLDSPSASGTGAVATGAGPSSTRAAAATPSDSAAGKTVGRSTAANSSNAGVLSVATPMSGSNLALAAAKVGKRAADPILAEKMREKAGVSAGKQTTCIACGIPSVRLAFARALEAAWVDAVIRLLAKREGKEEAGISIPVVQDAGLIGMGVDMASLQNSDKGPNVLIQALLAPVTDPDVAPVYTSLGHGRTALARTGTAQVDGTGTAQGSPASKKDALLQAVGSAEPSAVAAVLCTPHEYACVPSKPACYGDILARIRTSAYTKLADVVSDVKYVTRVAGVIAGVLPPEILSQRGDEPLPAHLQRVQAAAASGPLKGGSSSAGSEAGQSAVTAMPTPSWAVDTNTGEVNDEALRGGYVAPGDLPLPTVDVMSEANTSTASTQLLGVPVKTLGPQAFTSDQERLTAAINSGVADNPRMLFYQASLTVAEVFIRRFTKDRKQGKMLRDLEQRLSTESTGQPPLPEAFKVLPSPPEAFIASLYPAAGAAASTTSATSPTVAPTTWLPTLLEHLGLSDEDALARLFAARLSCSRPELSWTHRAYQFQRASLAAWIGALQTQIPAGGSRRPIDAAKKSLADEKNRRKSIIQAPGTDKVRYGTNFEDMMDTLPEADVPVTTARGTGVTGLASPSLMDVDLSSAAAKHMSLALKLHRGLHTVAHVQTAALRSASGGNVEPHSVLLLPSTAVDKDEAMDGAEGMDTVVPVGVAYDQAIAEYTAVDIMRVVKREQKRKQEQEGGGGSGQTAAAGKANAVQGPAISDAELQRCESAVVWARDEYLRVTHLPEHASGGGPLASRSPAASGEKAGLHRSKGSFFGVGGLTGAAEGRSGGGSAPRDVVPFEQPSWQPSFGPQGSPAQIPGLSQSAIADALAKLTQLLPGAHHPPSTLGHAPGRVVVIGSVGSSAPTVQLGLAAPADSARLMQAEQAIQALAQASQREVSSLRTQMGDMAAAMGVLLAGTAQAQASLYSTVSGLSTAISDLKTLIEEQGARSATGRRITPTMAVPAAPEMERMRTALGMLRAEERSAGVLLTEMSSMDLDMEAGQGGTPGLTDLLPPSPEEVSGIFDTLSASLRAGLVATGELRSAWAASRRALLSIPARVDVERRLVVRAGLDSDALAMQWNMGAGAETRLRRPPVLSPEAQSSAASGAGEGEEAVIGQQEAGTGGGEWVGDEDFSEGIITLGEGRVAAEYAVANAALRHHVNRLRMQIAAQAASAALQRSADNAGPGSNMAEQ